MECPALLSERVRTGLQDFLVMGRFKGLSSYQTYQYFIGGLDLLGHTAPLSEYILRGKTLADMSKIWADLNSVVPLV